MISSDDYQAITISFCIIDYSCYVLLCFFFSWFVAEWSLDFEDFALIQETTMILKKDAVLLIDHQMYWLICPQPIKNNFTMLSN